MSVLIVKTRGAWDYIEIPMNSNNGYILRSLMDETAQVEILKKAGLGDVTRSASAEAQAANETYLQLREEAVYLEELSTVKLKVGLGLLTTAF